MLYTFQYEKKYIKTAIFIIALKKALKKNISFCYTRRRLGIYSLSLTFAGYKNQELKWVLKV